jgi:hypothetical protein
MKFDLLLESSLLISEAEKLIKSLLLFLLAASAKMLFVAALLLKTDSDIFWM